MKWLIALFFLLFSISSRQVGAQDAQTPESAAAWQEDLAFLLDHIDRSHPDPYRGMPQAEFEAYAAELEANIPSMTDAEIIVGMMRLVSSLADGHSNLLPFLHDYPLSTYPLDLYQFSDGVYVVDASPAYADAIGARLLRIGETDVQEVVDQMARLVPRDNDSGGRVLLPTYLMTVEVLEGLDVIDDPEHPGLLLEYPDGSQDVLDPVALPSSDFLALFPLHYRLPANNAVLSLSQFDSVFSVTPLEDGRVIYAQHNDVLRIGAGLNELTTALNSGTVERLILDLRYNGGGDIANARPLLQLLNRYDLFDQPGSLIVLIGRNTFSAAVVFSLWMARDLDPVFIGEPSGGSPTMFENNRPIILPNSRLRVFLSTRARQDVSTRDPRRAIEPDVWVELSSADYFAGRDPALDTALAYTP